MTKIEAVLELLMEGAATRRSLTAARRIRRAADALDLAADDRVALYRALEYHNGERWHDVGACAVAGLINVPLGRVQ